MTGTEGETAVVALGICAVAPWVLFFTRRWKVTSPPAPKPATTTTAGTEADSTPSAPAGQAALHAAKSGRAA
jgi:hypothetical protein